MKCPQCAINGKRSKVFSLGESTTLMSWSRYWDEDGIWHSHDPNQRISGYRCSEGHQWDEKSYAPCPAGDYPKEK